MGVSLPSGLTVPQATQALSALNEALRDAPGPVVELDATALQEVDTSAIAVLLQCRRQVQARGHRLLVRGMPPKLMALMTLYGVSELFEPVPPAS